MFVHPFVRYAFLGGTAVALSSGLVGYFLVLRAQVFSADALSHVAVTGSLAALAFGVDVRLGLYASTVAVAVLLGVLGRRGRADDVVIGGVFAWILGLGVLFLSIFTTHRATGNGAAGVNVLFGSIYGLNSTRTIALVAISFAVAAVVLTIARPLVFATIDEAVAAARRVPVRLLGLVFLGVTGVAAAGATQAVGALLLLGLLAAPAATAQRITNRPFRAMWLSAGIAIACVWSGLAVSYAAPRIPPSFSIIAIATAVYALSLATGRTLASR